MKLILSHRFEKELQTLLKKTPKLVGVLEKTLTILQRDINHPSLRLHKLSKSNVYSISINMSLRILLYFENDECYLLRIGTHDQVY